MKKQKTFWQKLGFWKRLQRRYCKHDFDMRGNPHDGTRLDAKGGETRYIATRVCNKCGHSEILSSCWVGKKQGANGRVVIESTPETWFTIEDWYAPPKE